MLEWRGPEKCRTGARDCTATEILARRRRVRRMLGGSKREAAPSCGRRRRLACGRGLGRGGPSWGGRNCGDPGGDAETEQVCAEIGGQKYERAGDCGERGHSVAGVGAGRRLQSAARRVISRAVLGVWGKTGDRVEQSRRLRRGAYDGGGDGA